MTCEVLLPVLPESLREFQISMRSILPVSHAVLPDGRAFKDKEVFYSWGDNVFVSSGRKIRELKWANRS